MRGLVSDVQTERFQWGGANTFKSRIEAAERLADRLRELANDDVVIIAHSHGGNVARMASALAGAARGRRSLIALGTPFVTVDRRRRPVLSYLGLVVSTFAGGCVGLINIAQQESFDMPTALIWPAPAFLAASAIWVLLAITVRLAGRPLRRYSIDDLVALVDPQEPHATIIVFLAVGDEASSALSTAAFLGFLTARTTDLVQRVLPHMWAVAMIPALPVGIALALGESRTLMLFALVLAAYVTVGLTFTPALLLDWIDRVALGWDGGGISGPPSRRLGMGPNGRDTSPYRDPSGQHGAPRG
jgi:hypothetical protein